MWPWPDLDSVVAVHDDGDHQTQDAVDVEADEEVEVDAAVPPHRLLLNVVLDRRKRHVQLVTVHHREQALQWCVHGPKLGHQTIDSLAWSLYLNQYITTIRLFNWIIKMIIFIKCFKFDQIDLLS